MYLYLEELEHDEELEKEHDELDEQLELHEDDADEEQEEDSANAGDPTNKNDSTISRWIKAIKKRKFDFGFPVNPPTEHLLATRHNKLKAILSNKCTDRINITSVLLCFMGIALSIIST